MSKKKQYVSLETTLLTQFKTRLTPTHCRRTHDQRSRDSPLSYVCLWPRRCSDGYRFCPLPHLGRKCLVLRRRRSLKIHLYRCSFWSLVIRYHSRRGILLFPLNCTKIGERKILKGVNTNEIVVDRQNRIVTKPLIEKLEGRLGIVLIPYHRCYWFL